MHEHTNNIIFIDYLPAGMKHWGAELNRNLMHASHSKSNAANPSGDLVPAKSLQELSGQDEDSIVADARFLNPVVGDYRVAEDSAAVKLGFRNFPLDRFGVASPRLKKLARQPILPESVLGRTIVNYGWGQDKSRRETVVSWHGAQIKNLNGAGELSSTGMGKATGIYLKSVPHESDAYRLGLRERDVILAWKRKKLHEVSELLRSEAKARQDEVKNIA